jgi:hypothetical protein
MQCLRHHKDTSSSKIEPLHIMPAVTDFLNEEFPDKWIGTEGPNAWPPWLPDLVALDFIFWEYTKDIVYQMQVRDEADSCC